MPDLLVYNDGMQAVVKPKSDIGRLWLEEHIEAGAAWSLGGALILNNRLKALLADARADGLEVE